MLFRSSRCQIHKLKRLSSNEMESYIRCNFHDLSEDEVKQIIIFSDGIPGRCRVFLEDHSFKDIRQSTLDMLFSLQKKDKYIVKEYEKFFFKYKGDWQEILGSFVSYIRDIILYKELGTTEIIINNDVVEKIKELSNIYSLKQLNKFIDVITDVRKNLENRVNPALAFDVMLLNMQEV